MTTLASACKLLAAVAAAYTAFQAWQARQKAAQTDQVDTLADQGAADAETAKTPVDFQKAAAELEAAVEKS